MAGETVEKTEDSNKALFDLSDIMSILDDDSPAPVTMRSADAVPKDAGANDQRDVTGTPAVQQSSQQDNAFVSKLLSDIDQKNEEILRLNKEMVSVQFEVRQKEVDLKEKDSKIAELNSKIEDLSKQIESFREKVREAVVEQHRAPAISRAIKAPETSYNIKEDAPEEESVASIFKKLQRKSEEPEDIENEAAEGSESNFHDPYSDKPQPPRKKRTAKLYDL